jgi:2-alkyl-3-oxoalkanoate reductase
MPVPSAQPRPRRAEMLGANPPCCVRGWLALLAAGRFAVASMTQQQGASNLKARIELGWQPRYPAWRAGFAELLGIERAVARSTLAGCQLLG